MTALIISARDMKIKELKHYNEKKPKQIPEDFKTYQKAAEFWDTHDSTDFLDELKEIEIKVDIQKRHYLIEVDTSTAELLEESARKKESLSVPLRMNSFKNNLLKPSINLI